MSSVVYFIRAADGRIKIGVTRNLKSRLSSIRSASGLELEVLATLPGDTQLESYLHEKFAPHRISGEWFAGHRDIEHFAEVLSVEGLSALPHEFEFFDMPEKPAGASAARAARAARRLIELECDDSLVGVREAIALVAEKTEQSSATIWALLYRPARSVDADLLIALEAALERSIQNRLAALQNDLATIKASLSWRELAEIEADLAGLKRRLAAAEPSS